MSATILIPLQRCRCSHLRPIPTHPPLNQRAHTNARTHTHTRMYRRTHAHTCTASVQAHRPDLPARPRAPGWGWVGAVYVSCTPASRDPGRPERPSMACLPFHCRWYVTQAVPMIFIGGLLGFLIVDAGRVRPHSSTRCHFTSWPGALLVGLGGTSTLVTKLILGCSASTAPPLVLRYRAAIR
jgi:hypothetical protein